MANLIIGPKEDGVIITQTEGGPEVHHPTYQCCHCGLHFQSVKGSGKRRGFCMRCKRITCGHPDCGVCIPWERKMEMMEAGNE